MLPGSQARAHWGRSRLGVCNALVDRARRLIDEYGIMRQPSVTGLQALLLYNQLLGLTDQRHLAAQQYMESECSIKSTLTFRPCDPLVNSGADAHPRVDVGLDRSSTRDPRRTTNHRRPNANEAEVGENHNNSTEYRRIFWTVLISDAFNAVASGSLPKMWALPLVGTDLQTR